MKYLFLAISLIFTHQASAQSLPLWVPSIGVATHASVDLDKYVGRWYEFAAIPQSFQKQCVGNTTAEYGFANNNLISVVNSCDTKTGERSVAEGRAKVVDLNSKSKLRVTFVNFFGWQFALGGDYWILGIGENYSYAVVGSPGRDYAWILSRTPEMSSTQISEVNQILVSQGYDTCKLISTPQAGGLQVKQPVCDLAREE
ncbi:MAG: lipocalin family protein [Bdellovibrionaceae bacterium]|nr:lipocalin family protein [Pseudobdellovibrionaceae bacterium]